MLSSIDLFPYTFLWRIGNQPHHSHKCSAIASILLILIIATLLIQRLVTVLRMNSLTAFDYNRADSVPLLTTLSTFQNSSQHLPFMLAFNLTPNGNSLTASASRFSFWEQPNGTYSHSQETIPLQTCTPQHFSSVHKIEEVFPKLEGHLWKCLPLNRLIKIEGAEVWREQFSNIRLDFACTDSSCQPSQVGIQLFTLNTMVNPTSTAEPHQTYLRQVIVPLETNSSRTYSFETVQNIFTIDKSLFPWSSKNTQRSIITQQYELRAQTPSALASTRVVFERSHKTQMFEASHLKMVEAFALVGGVFQALLGVFFFITVFGRMFFEFNFARLYLRKDIVKGFGFPGYLKQVVYQILAEVHWKVKWEEARRRDRVRSTVNKLLDVVELFKRIDFIQNAVTSLLSTHELDSLLLLGRKGRQEVDENAKRLAFRDRIIVFIAKKRNLFEKYEKAEVQQKQLKNQKKPKQSKKAESLNPMKQGRHKKEFMTEQKRYPDEEPIESATNLIRLEQQMITAEMIKKTPSIRIMGSQISQSEEAPVEGQVRIYPCQLEKSDEEHLYQAAKAIGPMADEVLDAEELTFWFRYQYREFVERAAESDRCRRVKGFVEGWLLRVMEETAMELQKEPRLSCGKEIVLTPVVEKTFNEIVLEPVEEVPEEEQQVGSNKEVELRRRRQRVHNYHGEREKVEGLQQSYR